MVGPGDRAVVRAGEAWSPCSWQLEGQWWSTSDQLSAAGARVPSCWSLALPTKEMVWPTFHVKPVVGEVIAAVGGVLPAVTVTASVAETPPASVTRRPTRYEPLVV